jgi:1-acyl-sn-glycerol-3-phosphate acyltransferase
MFYIRMILLFFWLVFSCLISFFYAIYHWGHLNVNQFFARLYAWGGLRILGIQIEVEGREHLESHQPCVYIPNHQSNLDMVTYGMLFPARTLVIGKRELIWMPIFGLFFVAAGNILINRKKTVKAVAGLNDAVQEMKRKNASVWIFPEGTRNRSGVELLPFKRGAFHMALQAQIPLLPMVSGRLSDVVNVKERTCKGGVLRIKILPPIDVVKALGATSVENAPRGMDRLIEQTRSQMLSVYRDLTARGA